MRQFPHAFVGFAISLAASFAACAQNVPAELKPPPNEQLLVQVHGTGTQNYVCKADGAKFTWTLNGVNAQLTEKDGKAFGKHSTGPAWEALDGSRVTGKATANAPSPEADSIPWLLITVANHSGNAGVLSKVTSIQRLNTKGGKAPATGCAAQGVDQQVHVPYSADYLFFAPK